LVKLLCVSDIVMPQMESAVNLRRRYSDVDCIISCGDLPPVYLEFMVSVLNVPLYYVRGNHDEVYEKSPPGGDDIHKRIVTFNGLTFAGLEGSMQYNNGLIQYSEMQMHSMVVGMGPQILMNRALGKRIDLFITHSPPRGIHDAEDLPHTGFKAMLRFLEWYKPRYMLHGHVHTYDRRKETRSQYQDTYIINVNPVTVLEVDVDTSEPEADV
jgi:Icc-related predicted phosphoesterase